VTAEGGVRVEVLGPLRVLDGAGRDVTPSGVLQRRLLALLVLHRGLVVSVDAATDALWPSRLPRDPVGALQNHVSRLREVLPPGSISSVGDGYRLDASAVEVDRDRLARLLADGVALEDGALAELEALLASWHGGAFPELGDVDAGRAESMRLAELRVRAREVCAAHRLARGETEGLVAELTSLVDGEPLRERPRELLMAALAAEGRRAEALRVYDDFRRRIGDELGIEPSLALAAQQIALLQPDGDPRLPILPAARLPAPTTALIGREALVDEVLERLGSSRLVTLVGPGGVGKTRLLLEVGRRLEDAGRVHVALAELATADAGSVGTVVAASLGIDRRPDVPLAEQVAAVFRDTELVLLADNCEHVIDAAAGLLERMLGRCPTLRVIATSRERLRLPAEHVRPVPVLAVDGADSSAVRLFVERAGSAVGDFAPSADDLVTIGHVVRRLDGLPLAIELAAARLHTHDLADVAAGLDHRFALLSAGHRTSTRHASLGAAVSWSVDALDERLRAVFAGLSVFSGPFTIADASAVVDVDSVLMTAMLGELCERSLVARAPNRGYALLETLRAFGAEQLAAMGRAEALRTRHARYFLEWAERADRRMLHSGEAVIAEVDAALPELYAALTWLLDSDDVERAGRLVASLLDYGLLRLRPDVVAWAEAVVSHELEGGGPVASAVWAAAAYSAWMAGDVGEMGVRCDRALAAAARGVVGAEAATIKGNYELFQGRLDAALGWYRRGNRAAVAAGDIAQHLVAGGTELLALGYAGDETTDDRIGSLLAEVGDAVTPYAAHAWYCAGEATLATGGDAAAALLERALELAEQTGAGLVTGLAGASRASIEARAGNPSGAAAHFRSLIQHWHRAGMWSTQWTMLRSIAGLLSRLGHDRDAAVVLGAIESTQAGHRVFGTDAVVMRELAQHLQVSLGAAAYDAALAEGALLDGDAAVEHALRAL